MPTSTARRQNTSCDPYRRTKKRCAFEASLEPGMGTACQNCNHLGNKCTLEFATARAAAWQAKKLTSSATRRLSSVTQEQAESPVLTSSTGTSSTGMPWMQSLPLTDTGINIDMSLDHSRWAEFDLNEDAFDYDVVLASSTDDWMDLADKSSARALELNATNTSSFCPRLVESRPRQAYMEPQQPSQTTLLGAWHGSPARLLNSKVLAQHCIKTLCRIYDSMMMGLANRHLAYRCNQFAGKHSYILEQENKESTTSPSQQAQDSDGLLGLECSGASMTKGNTPPLYANQGFNDENCVSERVAQPYRRLTLIGAADNFGTLYGNKLDKKRRKQDETALTAVLHAFALQAISDDENSQQSWLGALGLEPLHNSLSRSNNTAPNRDAFYSAWFKAHSLLLDARDIRSFLHIHTVFLFHMIARPQEAPDKVDFVDDTAQFLDDALHQLKDLLGLVESFCSQIDPKSAYYSMLESSMPIVQWFGYVRDTISSFVSIPVRGSVLDDIQVTTPVFSPFDWITMSMVAIDDHTPEICQSSQATLFALFRQTTLLRELLEGSPRGATQGYIEATIETLTTMVDTFDASHGEWMTRCISGFSNLSTSSKQFSGKLSCPTLGLIAAVSYLK
ncbi:hypothetical protein GGI43DRAFT_94304 [Trichoderma evansii]